MNHVYGEEVPLGDNFTLCFCMYTYLLNAMHIQRNGRVDLHLLPTTHWLVIIHLYLNYIYCILLIQHPIGPFLTFVRIY